MPSDTDDLDVTARYAWNLALYGALYPILSIFEVTLRNRLFGLVASKYPQHYRPNNGIPCWLDFTSPILSAREVRTLERAKDRLPKPRKGQQRLPTPARLVAELTLDFWVYLFHEPYEKGDPRADADLWPKMLKSVFPSMDPAKRVLRTLVDELEGVRAFRNRVFHHEAVWSDSLEAELGRILFLTAAMEKDVGKLLRATETVSAVFTAGPSPWRRTLSPLVDPGTA